MLVDRDGKVHTYEESNVKVGDNWIAVEGCKLDLADKIPVDLVNWEQNVYTITL
jgi:hypothetical protein